MKTIDDVYRSNFLKADDIPAKGTWLTIRDASWEVFPNAGGKDAEKLVLGFEESSRELVVNATNARFTAEKLGTKNPEDWVGASLFLRCEEVFFGGKMVPAIRAKDAKKAEPLPTLRPVAAARPGPEYGGDDPGPVDEDFFN